MGFYPFSYRRKQCGFVVATEPEAPKDQEAPRPAEERYGEQMLAFLAASVREQMQMLRGCQASRDKGFKTVSPPADSHSKAVGRGEGGGS